MTVSLQASFAEGGGYTHTAVIKYQPIEPTLGQTTQTGQSTFESFRRDAPPNRSEKSMNKVPDAVRKELAALAARPESEIDFSDLPPTQASDWVAAERGKFYRPVKQQLTVRIDADVVVWLKGQGKGYQSRLNQILRAAMLNTPKHG